METSSRNLFFKKDLETIDDVLFHFTQKGATYRSKNYSFEEILQQPFGHKRFYELDGITSSQKTLLKVQKIDGPEFEYVRMVFSVDVVRIYKWVPPGRILLELSDWVLPKTRDFLFKNDYCEITINVNLGKHEIVFMVTHDEKDSGKNLEIVFGDKGPPLFQKEEMNAL